MVRKTLIATLVLCASATLHDRSAWASRVDELKRELGDLERQAQTLTVRYRAQAATPEQLSEHRLVDAQVLYNLRDYTRAAIILLDYVHKYKNTRGYPEAVFFLADSLYHKRDFLSARRYFRLIVNQVKGKYYQEALQRLVELSLRTGDSSDVQAYLSALANIPQHQLKPSVPYVRGKYYYFKKQTEQAIASFRSIPPNQKYYMHAQYFIGAALVRNKDFAGAAKVFQALLRVQPKGAGQQHIRTLTHLALGRLFYQKNKISEAIDQYQKVSRRSKEFDAALYEICWAYVKSSKYKRALRALDLLVLAQPKSPFIPQVRVLQGNLLIRLRSWGKATNLFQKTRDKFTPVHKRMNQIMAEQSDPNVFFDVLLARNLGDLSVTIKVPDLAVGWVKENPKVKRALHLVTDVREIKASVEEAQKLIVRLQRAINSPAKIKIFPEFASARASSLEIENRLALVRRKALDRQRQLVMGVASPADRDQLVTFAAKRKSLEQQIDKLPTTVDGLEKRRRRKVSKLGGLERKLTRLAVVVQSLKAQLVAAEKYFADTAGSASAAAQASFRKEAGEIRMLINGLQSEVDQLNRMFADAKDSAGVGGPQEVAERDVKKQYKTLVDQESQYLSSLRSKLGGGEGAEFDSLSALLSRCSGIEGTVTTFNTRIDAEVDKKLSKIRNVLDEEGKRVGKYKVEIGEYKGQTDQVAGGITYLGFQKVAKRFYEIVVRADVGIIDVAWALKDEKSKEVSRLVRQQKMDLKLLDTEFKEVLKKN